MPEIVVVNREDMVNYICVSLIADGMIVNEDLVQAILDAETDYKINYSSTYEEDE